MKSLAPRYLYSSMLIFILFSQSLSAQNQVSGTVLDVSGTPISYANVLLLSPVDSSLILGSLSDENGFYTLKVKTEGYLINVSMLGYKDHFSDLVQLENNTGMHIMPNVILREDSQVLGEVEIVGRKALFEQKIDRLVVNVANSLTSAGGTALEVLERSPGVLVNRQTDALSLIGKEGVVIMINGKQSYQPTSGILQMLDGMSADNIESIELITTPPANFDAEGNAGFINIVLKKSTDLGLNGNLVVSAGYGEGEVGSANISLNYRNNKLNVFSSYGFKYKAQLQDFYNYRKVIFEGNTTVSEVTTLRDPIQLNHNIRLGLDYEITDQTIVGFLLGAHNNKWTMDAMNEGRTKVNNILEEQVELTNDERNQWKHIMGNFNLQHKFTADSKLNFDIDYLVYEDENPNNYTTSYFDGENSLQKIEDTRSDKFTPINILVSQIDFETSLGDNVNFQAGIKGAYSTFTNDVSVDVLENSEWINVGQFTNKSDLEESIFAAFSSFDYKANEQNMFKFGLRYEYTDSQLDTEKEGPVVDRQFGKLFPSVFYSHTINDNNSLNLSYNRRISRPTFNDMAPFAIFIDPNTFFFGNAALQPAISDNVKVDYRHKSYLLSAQYSFEEGSIARFQDQVDVSTNQQAFSPINLKNTHVVSGTLALPFYIGDFWEMQNNFILVWQKINSDYNGEPFSLENTGYNLSTTQTFILPKDFSIELSGFYNSSGLFGRSTLDPITGMSFGIQKKFKKDRSVLRFNITDLFNSIEFSGGTSIPTQGFETDGVWDFSNRTFKLSYSRSFGNNKLKASRNRSTSSEEERRRVN